MDAADKIHAEADQIVAVTVADAKPVSARKLQRKLPRGASRLLPFKGRVIWPMPDGAEPIEFAHPPVKVHRGRRKSAKPAEANPAALSTESRDFAAAEEK